MEDPLIFKVREPEKNQSFNSSKDVYHAFKQYQDAAQEIFFVIYLNSQNQPIKTIRQSIGTINTTAIHDREIIKTALFLNATGLIFVHNHPGGDPTPSISDNEITKHLVYAAKFFELKVLDHVVIGNERATKHFLPFYSYGDEGLLDEYELQFQSIKSNAEIRT